MHHFTSLITHFTLLPTVYFLLFSNYYICRMVYVLLMIASLVGLAGCAYFARKNILVIREKNKNEPKAYKRKLNYVLTGLWYGYLTIFFLGLTINNLGNW